MRKIATYFILPVFVLTLGAANYSFKKIQEEEDWKLPVKGDFIQFDYDDVYANKTRTLCEYYTPIAFTVNLSQLITADLSAKNGAKMFSTEDYTMTVATWGENMKPELAQTPCKTDTLYGNITIIMAKQAMKFVGMDQDFNKITAKVRVIFEGKTTMHIRVRGFTLTSTKYNPKKQSAVTEIVDLETIYNKVLTEENPKKSETATFKDIKMLMDVFHSCVVTQLQKDIKVLED